MFKLNKKAFSTIEIAISMSIVSILFMSSLLGTMQYLKLKSYNLRLNKSIIFCEALINTLKYNHCEEEIIYMHNNSPLYVYEENMNIEQLKQHNLQNILSKESSGERGIYIFLETFENEENVNSFLIKLEFRTEKSSHKYELFKELKDE
ncbi:hypothetical protein GCM10008905_16940 [Clostridium malenominatum]|uniref:Prepilin-type N-terminal cleavage/methylation domain-containing protein n=1 Tax=Clostridium malenominatum TaxID=1539 RepID=A0ABN1IYG3_9CLOT